MTAVGDRVKVIYQASVYAGKIGTVRMPSMVSDPSRTSFWDVLLDEYPEKTGLRFRGTHLELWTDPAAVRLHTSQKCRCQVVRPGSPYHLQLGTVLDSTHMMDGWKQVRMDNDGTSRSFEDHDLLDLANLRQREGDQPLPVANDRPSIQSLVRADIDAREQVGISRYGTPLQPFNGRDVLRDAYEEALDLACYLRQLIYEKDHPDGS